jgi:predicted nucleic acid-binding protein
LKVLGLLGVLVEARRGSLIPAVTPLLTDLNKIAGFYMTPELIGRVQAACGEV